MSKNTPIPACLLLNPIHFLSLGFGSGLSRFAPGTMGTLAAIPVFLLMTQLGSDIYLWLTVFLAVLGIYLCGYTAKALGVHDHGGIVWDEVVGFLITMFMAPEGWLWIVIGFVLFRLFDIWKPWPIAILDKHVQGGLGIMLDDVLAGLFAWLGLQLLIPLIG
ncbi:MAG: phosphatidylglycerophosphatase A [Gammaproteobacteria bacterium]|nr:phosphatidylglycerophosphatase A [Gammaproteobacteria bacterium]